MKTIPEPIVSWETVVRLSDPLRAPSRQRLRTLKAARTATDGVRVTVRRGRSGRVSGTAVYYSALTALAARARQVGDEEVARRLTDEGSRIEEKFKTLLQDFLSSRPVGELASASFYPELVASTRRAVDFAWSDRRGDLIVGQIKDMKDDFAEIAGAFEAGGRGPGRAARVDLPAELIDQVGCNVGDYVWVLRRLAGSAAIITVLPAVDVELIARPHVDYLATGAGGPISATEAAYFAGLAEDGVPEARILRLAG